MVATLLRLKRALFARHLRSTAAVVTLVVGLLYAALICAMWTFGLLAAREAGPAGLGAVTVAGASLVAAGWWLASLVFFGSDETLDPARFAPLPLGPRDLLPGLALATLVGVPGGLMAAVAVPVAVVWGLVSPWLAVVAALGALLGVAAAVLGMRALTAALASGLASRRSRDASAVVLGVGGVCLGVGFNALSRLFEATAFRVSAFGPVADVLAWTPVGVGWALPGDAATGAWGMFAAHLAAALAWLALLAAWWARSMSRALTSPGATGSGETVAASGPLDRLAARGPAAAIASRGLRYWRRDPRYLATLAAMCVLPLFFVAPQVTSAGVVFPLRLVVTFLCVVAASNAITDIAYDSSALWLHISAGVRGRDDRAGRVGALLAVMVGPIVLVLAAAGWLEGWARLPGTLGIVLVTLLGGAGLGTWCGAYLQGVVPQPGENAFARSGGAGIVNLLLLFAHLGATLTLAAPVLVLAWFDGESSWAGWAALAAGAVLGVAALAVGVRAGGRALEARWPETLARITPAT